MLFIIDIVAKYMTNVTEMKTNPVKGNAIVRMALF